MKKYDLHKIMKAAHEIYRKYFKLYQLTHGVQTFGDCLKLAWANEKKRVADEEARKAAHPELGSDPFVPQRCRQLRPVAAAGYGVAQRVENFIFRFVRFAQAVLLDILFARCEVEPMPDGQLLAESLRTVAVVAVGDGTAVVVHPVEKDMQMGMFPVAVAGDDELRVSDAHAGEILRGDSDHPPVVEPCGVLCRKGEDDVADGLRKMRIQCRLHSEAADDGIPVFHPDAQSGEQFGVFSFVKDVIDGSAERTAFRYFGNHGYSLI